jgi:hypothetical protein
MNIDLRAMNRKLIKDARERFGHQPGLDLETSPLLTTFDQDDPEEFIA